MSEESKLPTFGCPRKNTMYSALFSCVGNIAEASRISGIDRSTHYKWIDPKYQTYDETYAEAVLELKDVGLDFAESQLFKLMKGFSVKETKVFRTGKKIITEDVDRNYPPDPSSVQFYLSTKGKDRGYTKRIETEDVGTPKTMRIEIIRGKKLEEDGISKPIPGQSGDSSQSNG